MSNQLKFYTSSEYMKENIDHWLYFFEKFQKQYIIIPAESYNYLFPEESIYIAVRSHPGFIHQ